MSIELLRFINCELCEVKESQEADKRYTHDEWKTHIKSVHPQWRLCKGCESIITTNDSERGRGWCEACVYLCLDCMDTEKYPKGL